MKNAIGLCCRINLEGEMTPARVDDDGNAIREADGSLAMRPAQPMEYANGVSTLEANCWIQNPVDSDGRAASGADKIWAGDAMGRAPLCTVIECHCSWRLAGNSRTSHSTIHSGDSCFLPWLRVHVLAMQSMRDPVVFRGNLQHHWRTGDKWKAR